jgi:hypothetical protein
LAKVAVPNPQRWITAALLRVLKPWMVPSPEVSMEKLLLIAALSCQAGDRLVDLSGKLPRGLQYMDFVVSLEPFYTRIYIYQLGYPDSSQQCCSNKPTSVLRVPIGAGRFCVRQSQPQMKWRLRAIAKPDIEM